MKQTVKKQVLIYWRLHSNRLGKYCLISSLRFSSKLRAIREMPFNT